MEIIKYRNKGKEHTCYVDNYILIKRSCSHCDIVKDSENFSKSTKRFLGHYPVCNDCVKIESQNHYTKNKSKYSERARKYYQKNTEKIKTQVSENTKRNRKKYNDYCYARDRDKRQRKLNKNFFKELQQKYKECRELSAQVGIKYVVDHIVPLFGENVSGLHVPWNVQFLTVHENAVKSNKWDGTSENNSWRKDLE
jgi:hypothetical protein